MQMSDLLKRLTPQERAALISMRRVPPQATANDKSLADFLCSPSAIAAACTDLNVFEFRLLEWLSMQPGLRASWSELQSELNGAIPTTLLLDYLAHMRRIALLDFKSHEKQGFVETYPAAVAILPSARRGQLQELLNTPSAETLGRMCAAAGIKNAPTRKDSRINALTTALRDPVQVRRIVSQISSPAQEFFSEMLERNADVRVEEAWKRFGQSNLSYYSDTRWRPDSLWGYGGPKDQPDPLTELMR